MDVGEGRAVVPSVFWVVRGDQLVMPSSLDGSDQGVWRRLVLGHEPREAKEQETWGLDAHSVWVFGLACRSPESSATRVSEVQKSACSCRVELGGVWDKYPHQPVRCCLSREEGASG